MEKAKVLVVDDEQDVRERVAKFLGKKIDCQIEIAASGEEAILKLKAIAFDLVILDIKMPGLSGIDVLNQVAKLYPQTKFLAISGYDSQDVAFEALNAGASDFISKPQPPEAIEIKVRQILTSMGKL